MKEIAWDKSYEVGVPLLDEQHKKMVGIVNRMIRAAGLPSPEERTEAVRQVLMEMTTYGLVHFQFEEGIMQKYRYPDLDAHKKSHKDYRQTAAKLSAAASVGLEVTDVMVDYLCNWWIHHILEEDLLYREHIADKQIPTPDLTG